MRHQLFRCSPLTGFFLRISRVALFVVLFSVPLTSSYATPHVLRVCLMDTELFPLWRKPGAEHEEQPGINIEMQQLIAQQLGHTIEWVRAPFPRCLVLLRQNEVDVLNVASYSPDREIYGRYPKDAGSIDISKRLKSDCYNAYVLKEDEVSFDGQHFYNLKNKPIAIEIGASIRNYLNDKNIPVYEVSRVSQAFGMLSRGRVSAVVTNQFNGLSYTSDSIVELPIAVRNRAYFLVISHQFYARYPNFADQLWEVSEYVREQHHQQLMRQYTAGEPW